ncbi:MAG: hypothetical protein EBS05_23385, partial [Proteobacteria bacterium]|nr:hypothetical protein [Pseudomonadota bacterium]
GAFTTFNGVTSPGLVALNAAGAVDSTFNTGSGMAGKVFVVALQPDGKVIVGGDFTVVNNTARGGVARLNADGSLDTTFLAGLSGADSAVRAALVQPDGKVVIGGSFTTVNGVPRAGVARLNPDGSLDAAFLASSPAADAVVLALAIQPDGRLLVTGDFKNFSGLPRNRVVRLNSDGSIDPTFNIGAGANGVVNAIAVQLDEKIVLGGGFSLFDGVARQNLVRLIGGYNTGAGSFGFESPVFTVSESGTNALITVRRSLGLAADAAVNFSAVPGTALASHFGMTNGVLSFPTNVVFATFNVSVTNTALVEGDRTVILSLTSPTGGAVLGGGSVATLIILEDDSAIGFSTAFYSVGENVPGGQAAISVTRTGNTNSTVSVLAQTGTNGTAGVGIRYFATNSILTFAPGDTTRLFVVPVIDDLIAEGDQTVSLSLTNFQANGTATALGIAGLTNATLLILDNEFGPGTFAFAQSTQSVSEAAGSLTVTVNRLNGSSGVTTVQFNTAAGTATAGVRYVSTNGVLTFASGDLVKTFVIQILQDQIVEGDQTFFVSLANPTGGANVQATNNTMTVLVLDDDSLVSFSAATYSAAEEGGGLSLPVQRTGGTNTTVTVTVQTFDGTAIGGQDYVRASNTLTFLPGQTAGNFTFSPIDDNLVNGDRTLTVSLSNAVATPTGTVFLGISNAVVTIVDNEIALAFSNATYNVSENAGRASISVVRTGVTNKAVSVDFATSNLTAIAGLDYVTTNGTLSFPVGVTNVSFDVLVTDNDYVNPARTVQLSLFNAVGPLGVLLGGITNATLTIVDNDLSSPVAGSVDISFGANLGANGPVYALAFHTNGQLVLGGAFTTVNGGLVNRIARLNTDGTLDQNFNPGLGANTNVYAVAVQADGSVLIGGRFDNVSGTNRARVARLNPDGSLDLNFDPALGADDDVYALAVQSDGSILAGGAFTNFGGLGFSRIVRLTANGALDGTFSIGAGANGTVRTIAVMADGRIVIAGDFTSYNGVAVPRIARLTSVGALDVTFNPGAGADNTVYSVAVQTNGSVVVGGAFTTFGGLTKNGLTRLNVDGSLDTSFNSGVGANGPVLNVALRSNGKLMVVGAFTTINGVSRNHYARLNADGGLDAIFDPGTGANNVVDALAVYIPPPVVPVQISGSANFFTVVNQTNIVDTGATSGVVNVTVFSSQFFGRVDNLRIYYQNTLLLNSNLVASNSFTVPYGPGTSTVVTVTMDEGSSSAQLWNYTGSIVPSINASERVAVGGDFTSINGVNRDRVAQLSESGPMDPTFGLGSGSSIVLGVGINTNYSLPTLLGKSVVVGNFISLNGANVSRVARLNLDGSLDLSFGTGTGANDTVNTLVVQPDGKVIIGGFFTNFNGVPRGRLARLNANGSLDTGFDTSIGANNVVLTVALQPDGRALVGGLFTGVNGTSRNFIARLNPDGTVDSTFNTSVGADGAVRAIAVQADGKVLVGGDFGTMNGTARSRLARLNTDGTLDAAFNNNSLGFNGFISALAVDASGRIIVGGSFTSVNGVVRSRIVRLTGATGTVDLTFDPGTGFDEYLSAITVQPDGKLLLVGGFTAFNGLQANRIARLNPDGSIDTTVNFGTGANNFVSAMAVQPWDQKILIGGAFTSVDGQARNGVARINAGANGAGGGNFEFSALTYLVDENATNSTVTVVRRGGLTGAATVQLATSDGTALQGVDYVGITNTLAFVNGQNATNLFVRILDNLLANPNKTVNLTLLNPSPGSGLGAVNPSTITIVDNDSQLDFSAATYSVTKSGLAATITVVRNGGSAGAVSVAYTTLDGTAVAGVNYLTVTNQLFWAAGDVAPKTFTVPIVRVPQVVGNQTVNLQLSNPTGSATLGRSTAVLTIVDDDFSPGVLGFSTNSYVANENSGTALITVVRTNGTTGPVSVQFATANGSAIAGVRYLATNGFLNFSDGQTTKTFSVPLINDTIAQGDQSVVLVLSNPGNGAGLGLTNAFLLIRDDEISNGILGFSSATYAVNENVGSAAITILRTNGSQGTVTANFTTADGTAKAGADYTITSGTIVFPDAVTNITFNIPILDNSLVQPNRVLNLSLSYPTGGATLGLSAATLTIIDDDFNVGFLEFTTTAYYSRLNDSLTELSIGNNFNIPGALVTVTRKGGFNGVVTVDFNTVDGSVYFGSTNALQIASAFSPVFSTSTNIPVPGVAGVNYVPTNGTLTFYEHEMAKSFVVPVIAPLAAFGVQLSNPTGGAVLGATTNASVSVEDTPIVGWDRMYFRVRENGANPTIYAHNRSTGPVPVLFTLSSYVGSNTVITAVEAGTDTASPGNDLTPPANVTIPAGAVGFPIPIPIIDDRVAEYNEEIIVQMRTNPGGGLLDECLLIILDNDDPAGAFDRDYNPDFDDRTSPPQNSAPGANNKVFAVAVQDDLKALVGGDFTAVNTLTRNRIARMNFDGSLDTTFNPGVGANAFVAAIGTYANSTTNLVTSPAGVITGTNIVASPQAGKIVLAGGFTSYNGISRNYIARVDTNGVLDASFNPGNGADGPVRALHVYKGGAFDGRVLVAGDFVTVNGTNRNHIARLDVNGLLDVSFNPGTGANGPVYAVRVQLDGKVVVGGDFTTFNGQPANRIARLTPTGALDASFNPSAGADGAVYALGLENPAVAAQLNRSSQGGPAEDVQQVNLGAATSGTLIINFDFLTIPDTMHVYYGANRIGANLIYDSGLTNGSSSISIPFGPSPTLGTNSRLLIIMNEGNNVDTNTAWFYDALVLTKGGTEKIILGGEFNNFDLRRRNKIARLNGDGSLDTTYSPGSGFDDTVLSIAMDTNGLAVVGGQFTDFNTTRRIGLARLLSDGTLDTTFMDQTFMQFAGLINLTNGQPRNFAAALAFQADGDLIIGG